MLIETAPRAPKRQVFLKQPNWLISREMRRAGPTRSSSCQTGTARAMVRCQVSGTEKGLRSERTERREVYGFTCTLASPVTNWICRCCEFLALTCTIDRELVPGASALITMPTIVPVPLAPAVFG